MAKSKTGEAINQELDRNRAIFFDGVGMRFFALALGLFLTATNVVRADGFADGGRASEAIATGGSADQVENKEQDLDPRLPPVLPGQEVRIGGKKMKVWSSSGPVPASEAPQAPNVGSNSSDVKVGEIGVVIDRRDK